jgi:succinate dehydrogenase / fumarate reductase iron-sulfur subunit
MRVTLKIWRQENASKAGRFVTYQKDGVVAEMSFLEMLDALNCELVEKGDEPVAFESDCREGICGTCSLVVDGIPHGPGKGAATCQLYMRRFKDGDTITVEPFRARAFPILRDLIVDRSAFDRVVQSGGFISVATGGAPDANALPIAKQDQELAMDAAQCIGCGACVAACKNASAMLFVAAKVSHLSLLPQGQPERNSRVRDMVAQMDKEGFGACTNTFECEAACPKEISVRFIARLNREYIRASWSDL